MANYVVDHGLRGSASPVLMATGIFVNEKKYKLCNIIVPGLPGAAAAVSRRRQPLSFKPQSAAKLTASRLGRRSGYEPPPY